MAWPSRTVLSTLLAVGLLLPLVAAATSVTSVVTRSKVLKEHGELMHLQFGVANFLVDYNAFPGATSRTPYSPASDDTILKTEGVFLDCLLGQKVWGNAKGNAFIDPELAKDGRNGLVGAGGTGSARLVDSWGNPYYLILDTNWDGRVANPDAKNTDAAIRRAPPMLSVAVIVFSSGPDGLPYTADDIASWRSLPSIGPTVAERLLQTEVILGLLGAALVIYILIRLGATCDRKGGR